MKKNTTSNKARMDYIFAEMAEQEAQAAQKQAAEQKPQAVEPGIGYIDEQGTARRTRSFAKFWQELD